MTREEAIKMAKADLKCMERDTSGQDEMCNSHKCDECSLNYERGNMGEQKEWLRLAIKALEQEPKWIPVTERLPKEESNTYWICTNNGCQCECRWTNVNPFWSYETTDWHWNIADIPQYTEVVAWMPLPEPYKEVK